MAVGGFDQVGKTHVGCRRKLNEDAILACPERHLWAVADGMGGHDAGEVASAMVVEALSRVRGGTEEILAALADVNARLVEMGRTGYDSRTVGSTVVGLTVNADSFTCFWAGDSRAYQLRDGKIARLTRDHSLVQALVDTGMIGEQEAETHPNANIITRAVGAADDLQVDVATGDLRPGDVFLLASDGLTRLLNDDEILSFLHGNSIEESAVDLLELALDRGAPDNVSLILLQATEAPGAAHMILQHGMQWQ